MKKFTILVLFSLFFSVCFAKNYSTAQKVPYSEYQLQISDKLYVGSSESFECLATIAHFAGFEEYNQTEYGIDYSTWDSYFSKYLDNKDVNAAINYFKKLRIKDFSYDAIANASSYITPDCHSLKYETKLIKKYMQKRCGDPEKMVYYVSKFFDATNFDSFYQSQIENYKNICQTYIDNAEILNSAIYEIENYFKKEIDTVYISVSEIIGYSNYGNSFYDGNVTHFNPHYCSTNFNINLFIHELCHPFTSEIVEKVMKNKELNDAVNKRLSKNLEKKLAQDAYPGVFGYLNEMLNRANTIVILNKFLDENQLTSALLNDYSCGFLDIFSVYTLFTEYQNGNYQNQLEFSPYFEEKLIETLKNSNEELMVTYSDNTVKLLGNKYDVSYLGEVDLTGFRNFKSRKFWKINDAYKDLKVFPKNNYLPFNNYPFDVEKDTVYLIQYFMNDGTTYYECYYTSDDYIDGDPVTYRITVYYP